MGTSNFMIRWSLYCNRSLYCAANIVVTTWFIIKQTYIRNSYNPVVEKKPTKLCFQRCNWEEACIGSWNGLINSIMLFVPSLGHNTFELELCVLYIHSHIGVSRLLSHKWYGMKSIYCHYSRLMHFWCLWMVKKFHPKLYKRYNCIFMLG